MIQDLNNRFKNIKNILFPKWDIGHEWKISNNNKKIYEIENTIKTNFMGFCDKKSKTIYLNIHEDDWKTDMLIVHEICHTFRYCGTHGRLWIEKMSSAAKRCDQIKNFQLADQIRHELENYHCF